MALIKCNECGKEISSRALTCPNCGCPTEIEVKSTQTNVVEVNDKKDINIQFIDEFGIDILDFFRSGRLDEYKIEVSTRGYLRNNLYYSNIKKYLLESYHPKRCDFCNKKILVEDPYCIHCGESNLNEVKESTVTLNQKDDDLTVKCPRCGSKQIAAKKKGFGLGKAIIGNVLIGPYGLLGGVIGSNKTLVVCLKCGKEWKV